MSFLTARKSGSRNDFVVVVDHVVVVVVVVVVDLVVVLVLAGFYSRKPRGFFFRE